MMILCSRVQFYWPSLAESKQESTRAENIYLKCSGYLEGIDDQVPGLQFSLQDAEEHQQLWFGQALHIHVGLWRQTKGWGKELRCCQSNYKNCTLCFHSHQCSWKDGVFLVFFFPSDSLHFVPKCGPPSFCLCLPFLRALHRSRHSPPSRAQGIFLLLLHPCSSTSQHSDNRLFCSGHVMWSLWNFSAL